MANLALATPTPSQSVRFDYNGEHGTNASPPMFWPSIGGGASMRENEYVPIAITGGGGGTGGTTGYPIIG